MFKKYQHLEKFGTTEVEGIELGECLILPKIDGTNGSAWLEDGVVQAGSRNRHLSLEDDNQGFYKYILEQDNIKEYLERHPTYRIFGEFLIPHSLRTYKDTAWRKFYVFDVVEDLDEELPSVEKFKYIHYDEYSKELEELGINYITPIAIIKNGSAEQFYKQLEHNDYLIKDGQGTGEGLVIKRYDYINKYGRITWAKIVTSEFKDKHRKEMGANEVDGKLSVEEKIVDEFCTDALIEKEYEKIVNDDGWSSKMIPRLLNTVFYSLVKEECWEFVKKNKNPTINFKNLSFFVSRKVKQVKSDLF